MHTDVEMHYMRAMASTLTRCFMFGEASREKHCLMHGAECVSHRERLEIALRAQGENGQIKTDGISGIFQWGPPLPTSFFMYNIIMEHTVS